MKLKTLYQSEIKKWLKSTTLEMGPHRVPIQVVLAYFKHKITTGEWCYEGQVIPYSDRVLSYELKRILPIVTLRTPSIIHADGSAKWKYTRCYCINREAEELNVG